MKPLKHIKHTHVRQHGEYSCGLACLASIVKYHEGEIRQEQLRHISGTTLRGTTILGLYQAANKIGFDAEGYGADIENLKKIENPVVLHVIIDNKRQHFVVCYGFDGKFMIGDPGWGVVQYTEDELNAIWQSKTLMALSPNPHFAKAKAETAQKRKWIGELVKEDLPILSIAAVLGIVIAILGLATAIFSQKLIDNILPSGNISKLVLGLALFATIMLMHGCIGYVRGIFLVRQSRDFNNRIINSFFGKLLYLPKTFFESCNTGEMIARMNDAQRIQRTIIFLTSSILIDALVLAVSSLFIFVYSVPLALLALASIPLYGLLAWRYNKKVIEHQREVMVSHAENESNYVNTLQGISVIKSSNKEDIFATLTKNIYGVFQDKIYNLGILRNNIGLLQQVIGAVLITSVIALASINVLDQSLQLGEMIAVLTMVGAIIPAASNLVMANIQLQEAKIAFDRMFEFANTEPEYEKAGTVDGQVQDITIDNVSVQNINFRFPGNKPLLHDVSFSVKRGEIITLFGEIGCGKSSILKILQRFYNFESGKIIVNNNDWTEIDTYEWRHRMGIVSQDIKLFNGTLLDNICLGNSMEEAEKVVAFCRKYHFDEYFEALHQGYLTILGEDGINISGGQKQLIALARALYRQPQLLLLDEATAAMDRNTEEFVIGLLHTIKEEIAVVLVSHRVQVTRNTDYIYVIDKGRVVAHGKHDELVKQNNLYSGAFMEVCC